MARWTFFMLFALMGVGMIGGSVFGQIRSLGVVQAVGFYTAGSLVNPSQLPLESDGLVKIFRPRDRGHGTQTVVDTLVLVGQQLSTKFPTSERLQIGDISSHDGGVLSGHSSHQNGLDVDVCYLRKNRQEIPINTTSGFEEEFVVDGKVTGNFAWQRNWFVFRELVKSGLVSRIFVDPKIKALLCKMTTKSGVPDELTLETLRRLRPWKAHGDHFHLRFQCPADSPDCTPQAEPPVGSGCDEISLNIIPRDPNEM